MQNVTTDVASFLGPGNEATTDGTAQTISGLTPNIAVYTFRVAAVGTNGVTGPFSNPANTSAAGKYYRTKLKIIQTVMNGMFDCRNNTYFSRRLR